ncbi:MAG TPA: NAD(P)/FAD-dependent oxidoreductase [Gemmatimonadaceae bacterium]|nr:NAD(P)/FAD-dependent oxidoreductase [Gemmatimonadaceae bacterium]
MPETTVVVVGGGASGLSAAASLKRNGVDVVVLERDQEIGGTWSRRYDRLHLHTVRGFSGLAHYGISRRYPAYLSRDQFVEYLREYADHFGLQVMTDCQARRVAKDPDTGGWQTTTVGGATWRSKAVVVATGQYREPLPPRWPGAELFRGELTHSADYHRPAPYAGKRVLVVGAGNSGAEIATDVAEHGASFTAISIRSAPPIVPRDPFGMPVQRTGLILSALPPRIADRLGRITARIVLGDLTAYGIPRPQWGPFSSRRVPVIDVGFVAAVKRGMIKIRPALERLTESNAVFADGSAEPFDAIIAATGFSAGLENLIDDDHVLNQAGEPIAESGSPSSVPGLYFIGFNHSLRGQLFESNLASRRLARNVGSYLSQQEN